MGYVDGCAVARYVIYSCNFILLYVIFPSSLFDLNVCTHVAGAGAGAIGDE